MSFGFNLMKSINVFLEYSIWSSMLWMGALFEKKVLDASGLRFR
jgi:hypothetical protein